MSVDMQKIETLSQEEKEFVYRRLRLEHLRRLIWLQLSAHYGDDIEGFCGYRKKEVERFAEECLKCEMDDSSSLFDNYKFKPLFTEWVKQHDYDADMREEKMEHE